MMKKVFAFLTFDQLVTEDQIKIRVQHLRYTHEKESNELEPTSVWHELIYEYWYNYVISPYL